MENAKCQRAWKLENGCWKLEEIYSPSEAAKSCNVPNKVNGQTKEIRKEEEQVSCKRKFELQSLDDQNGKKQKCDSSSSSTLTNR